MVVISSIIVDTDAVEDKFLAKVYKCNHNNGNIGECSQCDINGYYVDCIIKEVL